MLSSIRNPGAMSTIHSPMPSTSPGMWSENASTICPKASADSRRGCACNRTRTTVGTSASTDCSGLHELHHVRAVRLSGGTVTRSPHSGRNDAWKRLNGSPGPSSPAGSRGPEHWPGPSAVLRRVCWDRGDGSGSMGRSTRGSSSRLTPRRVRSDGSCESTGVSVMSSPRPACRAGAVRLRCGPRTRWPPSPGTGSTSTTTKPSVR